MSAEMEVLEEQNKDGNVPYATHIDAAQAALYAALAAAQAAFPAIPRDRTVKVTTKTGGSYTFAYAPLDTILEKVRPALAENGLAIAQSFDGLMMNTLLLHSGGGSLSSRMALDRTGPGSWQEFGSAITYARRYALVALLGIASEEDDDGNHASGNTAAAASKPAGASRTRTQPTHAPSPATASAEHLEAYRADVEAANLDWPAALAALGPEPVGADTLAQHREQLAAFLAKVAAKGTA